VRHLPSAALLHRSLFEELGTFDEDLPACEDYDLWLRICATEPVAFVPEPRICKYGGHDDQLSGKHWGMDRFRVRALEKIIGSGRLTAGDHAAGARKRGHAEQVAYYESKQQAIANRRTPGPPNNHSIESTGLVILNRRERSRVG